MMMPDVKLSIIIPVYNELNTILEVIKCVQNEGHEKEIIVVDDASTDGTRDLLSRIDDKNIKVFFHDSNKGKGSAIRTAIHHVTGDIVIIQDADLEYYPDEYGILIRKLVEGKADVVYGTRFLGAHRDFYHYLGNSILNIMANVILDVLIKLKSRLAHTGRLILVVPAHETLYSDFDRTLGHRKRYSKQDLIDKLIQAGFTLEKIEYMNFLAAVGWFAVHRVLRRKHMSAWIIRLADRLIPLVALMESYIDFSFGLSLIAIAKAGNDQYETVVK